MYEDSIARVKSMCGIIEDFNVGIGVHQGSALKPLPVFCSNG